MSDCSKHNQATPNQNAISTLRTRLSELLRTPVCIAAAWDENAYIRVAEDRDNTDPQFLI